MRSCLRFTPLLKMKKRQLLKVAQSIIQSPLDTYKDERYTTYTGLYRKRPMCVCVNNYSTIIAISYNRVLYKPCQADRRTAPLMKRFYFEHNCVCQVQLYSEASYLFRDSIGVIKTYPEAQIADYSDVIPIPYTV